VRGQADRVLSRVGVESGAEEPAETAASPEAGAREADRSVHDPAAAAAPPDHWRRLVETGPPRHWLERVEAARRRFARIHFDARARVERDSPESVERVPPAADEPIEHRQALRDPEPSAPPLSPRRAEHEQRPTGELTTRRRHEPLDKQPLPRQAPPAAAGTQHEKATLERVPSSMPAPKPRERRLSPPIDRDGAAAAPAVAPGVSTSWSDVEPARISRRPAAPADAFAWRTAPRGDSVPPITTAPPMAGAVNGGGTIPAPEKGIARRVPESAAPTLERRTTSRDFGDLVWPEVPLPEGALAPAAGGEPARRGERTRRRLEGHPIPPPAPHWPSIPTFEERRPPAAAGAGDAARFPAVPHVASEDGASYTDEPEHRWPELSEMPGPSAAADWLEIKRRLDRVDRLNREQRGW
jgi:hypothetical protein